VIFAKHKRENERRSFQAQYEGLYYIFTLAIMMWTCVENIIIVCHRIIIIILGVCYDFVSARNVLFPSVLTLDTIRARYNGTREGAQIYSN
jgi:hypothetical protein